MDEEDQLELPLDERFREAEQYALDLGPLPEQWKTEPDIVIRLREAGL